MRKYLWFSALFALFFTACGGVGENCRVVYTRDIRALVDSEKMEGAFFLGIGGRFKVSMCIGLLRKLEMMCTMQRPFPLPRRLCTNTKIVSVPGLLIGKMVFRSLTAVFQRIL